MFFGLKEDSSLKIDQEHSKIPEKRMISQTLFIDDDTSHVSLFRCCEISLPTFHPDMCVGFNY